MLIIFLNHKFESTRHLVKHFIRNNKYLYCKASFTLLLLLYPHYGLLNTYMINGCGTLLVNKLYNNNPYHRQGTLDNWDSTR